MSDELRAALHDAITDVLHKRGRLATRWTICVETIKDDGGLTLGTFRSPGLRQWEALGMITFTRQQWQACAVADVLEDDDD